MKTKLLFLLIFLSYIGHAQSIEDYVARYNFANTSGINVLDPGNGDLTTASSVTPVGTTDRFANVNQSLLSQLAITYGGYNFTGTVNSLTLSFYFQGVAPSSTQRIAQIYDSSGHGFRAEISPGGGLSLNINNAGNTLLTSTSSFNQTFHDGAWRLITITIEKTTSNYLVRTYQDGVNVGTLSTTINDTSDFLTNNAQFVLNPTSTFNRAIDDIIIYERALSASEVSELYIDLRTEIVYVDANATGLNNGSDWENAYTDPASELNTFNGHRKDFWIARGTYVADPGNPNAVYSINGSDVRLYGGFTGIEKFFSERDEQVIHTTNSTVLSGDVAGNDNGSQANFIDNKVKVISANADNLLIDGITIEGGYYDGPATGNNQFGAGITSTTSVGTENLILENCILENNHTRYGSALTMTSTAGDLNLVINRCIFRNNSGYAASSLYVVPNTGQSLGLIISNSLFNDNISEDISLSGSQTLGIGASTGWVRAFYSGSTVNVTIVNNTFSDNLNNGTGSSDFATFGLSRTSGSFGSVFEIANNIFWNNRSNNGAAISKSFGGINANLETTMPIANSIGEDNFSNYTNTTNISNADPLLTSSYQLSAGSPAIDSGNNSVLSGSFVDKDLAGNNRIDNTLVDLGALEFQSGSCISTVNIPDANFKTALLDHGIGIANTGIIDTDGDGEICTTEAQAYTGVIRVET